MELRGSDYGGIALGVSDKSGEVVEVEKIKQELEKTRKLNEDIQKAAGLGAYIFDAKAGRWTSTTMMDKIFGIKEKYKKDIKGWVNLIHPEFKKEMREYLIRNVLEKKQKFDKEYKIIRPVDGVVRWVHGLGDLKINKEGKVDQMIGTIQDITEKKLVEIALKKSEERYKRLYFGMMESFVVVSFDGKILDFNDAYPRMTGYKASELKKLTFWDLTPKKWNKFENEIIKDQVMKRGVSDVYEKEYRRKNGTIFPVELRAYLIKDEKGKPESMWAIIRDITARKKIENTLLVEKERLNSILVNTRHGIALSDKSSRFILVNPYFCKLMGYSEAELLGQTFKKITYPGDIEGSLKLVKDLTEGRISSISMEKRYIKKNKQVIWAKLNIGLIKDENGEIINYVISVDDITDTKLFEEALSNSEEQLSTVLMNMNDGVFVVDEQGRILLTNKALEKLTGYSESQLTGNFYDIKIIFLSERKGDLLYGPKGLPLNKEVEITRYDGLLLTKSGEKIPIEGHYSPIMDVKGVQKGGVMVLRDATETRKVDRMRTDFISLASHQLRTPLTGIKWFVELIAEQMERLSKDDLSNYVKRIKESNERLISLVNDLLQVSRIESGKQKAMTVKGLCLKNIIERSLDDQMGLIGERKVKIKGFNNIPEKICLDGDETQLIQIFGNVINNAVKYSPMRSTVDIKMSRSTKNKVVVMVADRGVGIPRNQQTKLFEKFFRGDNVVKDIPGSGLGLYVVKSMLEGHGGKIWIKSVEGKGTKVFIELPIGTGEKMKG